MYKVVKNLILTYSDWAYHSRSNKLALKTLKSIESANGKTDSKLIKLSDQYASDTLGWKGYAPWLYVYSAMNKKFQEGWIPDNYFGKVVAPKLKGNYGSIADYNGLTGRLLQFSCFPICAYYINGLWISPSYKVITDEEVLDKVLNESDKYVYKTDKSRRGLGVYIVKRNNFKIEEIKRMGNGVLQKFISQHSFFQEITPNSVATLRVTSVINDEGEVSIRACFLRVGRSSDTHVISSSHIRIPVNISTGLLDFGYSTNWIQVEKHPDTNFEFKDKKFPCFDKCIKTVKDLHKMIPFARTVGWDLIIDRENNVQVMEWNGSHHDVKFSEATQGPSFSDLGWEELWKEVGY